MWDEALGQEVNVILTTGPQLNGRMPRWRPDSDSLESLRDSFVSRSTNSTVPVPTNHDRKWSALEGFMKIRPVTVLLVASGARWWLEACELDGRMVVRPRV